MMKYILVIFIFLYSSTIGYAEELQVSQQIVADDFVPPTVPAPVSATAVASSQVDITWGASTDDQTLSGYRLFRDGFHIATTTLLTYSDAGLSASTTYVYTVQAFDSAFNISTTSAAATATTPNIAAVSNIENNPESYTRVRMLDLTVSAETNYASMAWKTNIYAQYILRWGTVDGYDLGLLRNELFKRSHVTVIPDLQPGTTYMYELIAYNQRGKEYVLSRDSFTTKEVPDITPPANVTNVQVQVIGDDVVLSWSNPKDSDFQKVRVVRSSLFYPRDILDGYIVYQGNNTYVEDLDSLQIQKKQYYTIFTYDNFENVSSGVVVLVDGSTDSSVIDKTINVPSYQEADLNVGFLDIQIFQKGTQLNNPSGEVFLTAQTPTDFKVSAMILPKYIKTIILRTEEVEGKVVSYMMRLNKDTKVYEVTVPDFNKEEILKISLLLYNFKTELTHTITGYIQVTNPFADYSINNVETRADLSRYVVLSVGTFLISFLLWLLYFLFMRKREDK